MENKNKSWFAKTQDEYIAKELMEAGYKLIDCTNGTWTFINKPDGLLTFDAKKIVYSDKLCF